MTLAGVNGPELTRSVGETVKGIAALVMALGTVALLYQQHQSRRYSDLSDQLRHELSGSHVANGVRLVDEGDLLSSLPWFVEAMRLDLGDTSRELMHRRRCSVLMENAW